MTSENSYSAPMVQAVGKLHQLTLAGVALGKGSMCADGTSGLQGNRSDNSGSCE